MLVLDRSTEAPVHVPFDTRETGRAVGPSSLFLSWVKRLGAVEPVRHSRAPDGRHAGVDRDHIFGTETYSQPGLEKGEKELRFAMDMDFSLDL